MLENLTKSIFAENVNSSFNMRHETGQPLALELVELREGAPQSDYEQFSLFFKGPRAVVLPQRSYELEQFMRCQRERDPHDFRLETQHHRQRQLDQRRHG